MTENPARFDTGRLERAVDGMTACWRGERTGPLLTVLADPAYRQGLNLRAPNYDDIVRRAVAVIEQEAASGEPWVLPSFYADFGTISTAKLYGGKIVYPRDGGNVHIEPVARTVADLDRLTPCAFEESDLQLSLDLYRRCAAAVAPQPVYLRTPDFQGPMNTLALLMDQQALMMAFYDEPDAIHAALDHITDTLIAYHQRLHREAGHGHVIGNIWPYTFLPNELGVSLTQDMMPLLSADLYRTFELPRLRRIAEAFGGVMVHCCGKYVQHLPALRDQLGDLLLGLEFHYPFTPFEQVYDIFGDRIVYVSYLFSENRDYPSLQAYLDHLLATIPPQTRLWIPIVDTWVDDLPALRQKIEALQ